MKNLVKKLLHILPDELHIQLQYFYHLHRFANLKNPQTFNEKLQWLKLHDHNSLYTTLVDKYAVKKWVADRIGEQYIIPILGVWEKAQDIDFDKLPNQFVLKVNHDSGGIVICRDKSKLGKQTVIAKLSRALKNNGYWYGREWAYRNVKPCIIAEKFLSEGEVQDLIDYKFYCFNGIPKYCQVIMDRSTQETIDFFDMKWELQHFTGLNLPGKPFPHAKKIIHEPINFEQMKQGCRKLAAGISFVRVDFYEVKGKMYFGEMTFFPASGFGEFTPTKWNKQFSEWLTLNLSKNNAHRKVE